MSVEKTALFCRFFSDDPRGGVISVQWRLVLGDGGTRCEAASCSRTCRRRYGRVCCYTRPDRYASAHAPAPSLTSVRCRASKGEVGSLDWALAPEGGSLETPTVCNSDSPP